MKRALSFMLAALLFLSMLPSGGLTATAEQVTSEQVTAKVIGDLDQDGEVTDWDGVLLTRYLAGWSVSIVDEKVLDIDGDGEITDLDSIMFDRYLAGWSVESQIGKCVTYTVTYENTKDAINTNPTSYESGSAEISLSELSLEHYIFAGWYIGDSKVTHVPTNLEEDLTIAARWTPVEYAIVYENTKAAVNSNPTTYHIESNTIKLQDLVCEGYVFDGWYRGNEKVTEIVTGTAGDITLTAMWTACDYTITYENTLGVINHNPTTFRSDSAAITLSDLEKEGYTFDGWYQGTKKVTAIPAGTVGDITLTARWTPILYTATFISDGDVVATRYFTVEDDVLSDVPNVPYKAGYVGAWSNYKLGAANVVIPAVYTLSEYTITYANTKGVENYNPDTYTVITSTFPLAELQLEGYDFLGWYKGSTKVTVVEKGSIGNLTLTAKWSPVQYVITYTDTKGAFNTNPVEYNVETGTIYLTNLVAEHYTFEGWYWNGKPVTSIPAGNIGDIELRAQWTPIHYTINYKDTKGATNSNPATYTIEDFIILQDLSLDGYVFEGWFIGSEKVTSISVGSYGKKTLTAKWTPITYSITYQDEKNLPHNNPTTYTVENDTITLSPLSAAGYTFEGWYWGNTQVTEIPAGSLGDMALTAMWTLNTYTITYQNTKDVAHDNPTSYTSEDQIVLKDLKPTSGYPRFGYTFDGWYHNGEKVTEITPELYGDLVLTAKWSLYVYKIQYTGLYGATNPNTLTSTTKDTWQGDYELQDPGPREGYTFVGWRPLTSIIYQPIKTLTWDRVVQYTSERPSEGVVLQARWNPIEYPIQYVSNIGLEINNPNPATYAIEDTLTFKDASAAHHTFKGWYADADYLIPVTTVEKGSMGPLTLYAKWEFDGTCIYTAEDFAKIAYNPGGAYQLKTSIHIDATICDSLNPFSGYFDGNNCTIYGKQPFDVITGTVTRVKTQKALATENKGYISYCIGSNGLVQTNSGIIKFSGSNAGYVYTSQYSNGAYECVAGLVGTNTETGEIIGCYSKTEIGKNYAVEANRAGGLVGRNEGLIENSYFNGYLRIERAYPQAAGLVGRGYGTIRNCYATGSVSIVAKPTGTGPNANSAFGITAGLVADLGHTIENSFSCMYATAGVSVGGSCTTVNTYYASDMCSYAWAQHNYYEVSASGTGGKTGTGTISSNFKSATFVQNTLGWSTEYWTFENGNLPKLAWEE